MRYSLLKSETTIGSLWEGHTKIANNQKFLKIYHLLTLEDNYLKTSGNVSCIVQKILSEQKKIFVNFFNWIFIFNKFPFCLLFYLENPLKNVDTNLWLQFSTINFLEISCKIKQKIYCNLLQIIKKSAFKANLLPAF